MYLLVKVSYVAAEVKISTENGDSNNIQKGMSYTYVVCCAYKCSPVGRVMMCPCSKGRTQRGAHA